jgi:predicted DNA-binding transcriptional regulator AlpA
MTETSVIALLGAPAPAEDAPARPAMIRRRAPEHHLYDLDAGDPAPVKAVESLHAPQPPPIRHHLDRRAAELAQEGAAAGEADDLLNTSEVAEWLGISLQWLEIGRSKGYGPRFVRLSPRRVRYLRSSVMEWLRERQHQGTAEYSRRPSGGAPVDAA